MYCSWKELDIRPSRELVDENMPSDFKRLYPSTRVIIESDGMEVPIKKIEKQLLYVQKSEHIESPCTCHSGWTGVLSYTSIRTFC